MTQPGERHSGTVAAWLDEPDAARLASILGTAGAVEALDDANALDRLLTDALDRKWAGDHAGFAVRMALVPAVVAAGVSVNRVGQRKVSPLAFVISLDELPPGERAALVGQLVAAGADPQLRRPDPSSHRASAAGMLADHWDRVAELRPLVEPALTGEGRIDALIGLLTQLVLRDGTDGYDAVAGWLADLVERVPTVDVTGAAGLGPIHLAALSGDVELLGRILARAADPDLAATGSGRLAVRHHRDTIWYVPGKTAVDLVDRALVEIDIRTPRPPSPRHPGDEAVVERLTRCRAALVRAGGHAVAASPPPPVSSTDLMGHGSPAAHLVAGRVFTGPLDRAELESMCAGVDAFARRLGVPLVVLYLGQVDSMLPDLHARLVVGLHIARAAEGRLTQVRYGEVLAALERAETLPWRQITDEAPEGPLRESLAGHDTTEVYGAAVGSAVGFRVGFGVPGDPPDRGEPIYGVSAGFGAHPDVPVAVDFSTEAHTARLATLGQLADLATYHLTPVADRGATRHRPE